MLLVVHAKHIRAEMLNSNKYFCKGRSSAGVALDHGRGSAKRIC